MEYERIFYEDAANSNKIKSFLLLFFAFVVASFSGTILLIAMSGGDIHPIGAFIVSLFLSLFYVFVSYFFWGSILKWKLNLAPLKKSEYPYAHSIVEGLSIASDIPKPKLYLIESDSINAFASGISPDKAFIGITRGALEKLNDRELSAVLAHEVSHIANYDIRFLLITSALVGWTYLIFRFSTHIRPSSRSGGRRSSSSGASLVLLAVVGALFTFMLSFFIKLAISRQREYLADTVGAKMIRDPDALISALNKIKSESSNQGIPGSDESVSHLFFFPPTKELFSTHPPIEKRISALKKLI